MSFYRVWKIASDFILREKDKCGPSMTTTMLKGETEMQNYLPILFKYEHKRQKMEEKH